MSWTTPWFEMIEMNAEIGGYQADDRVESRPPPPEPHEPRETSHEKS